eukprot:301278_1
MSVVRSESSEKLQLNSANNTLHPDCNEKAGSPSPGSSSYSPGSSLQSPPSDTVSIQFPLIQHNSSNLKSKLDFCSPTKSLSLSHCRYCYKTLCRKSSVSQCHCNGNLCKVCLIREVVLTYNRSNHEIQCTVCHHPYDAKTEFKWKWKDYRVFHRSNMIFCGLKNEEYLLNSTGGKLGYALVILGIAIWIVSTSFVFTFPPYELPLYLYYMIAVFDLVVGVATLWFVTKCRWLTSFVLSVLYFLRCLYLLSGWTPIAHLLHLDDYEKVHINVMSYFVSFSFIA